VKTATFTLDRPIPHVLTKEQLAAITGYSTRTIDRYRSEKNHPGIVQLDGPGAPRFSGRALQRWIERGVAEPAVAPRHFFRTASNRG
jgi:predicted DNA-binding transcriptional regulator AlpA